MKNGLFLPMITLFGLVVPCVSDSSEDTGVIGGVHRGQSVETEPQERTKERDYIVKQTVRQTIGNRNVTIQEVEPPVIKPQLEQLQPQNSQIEESLTTETSEEEASPEFIVVTATVYGSGTNTRSQITLSHKNQKCVAISRADFRIMSGFTQFKANGRPYFIISHIVDANSPGQESTATPPSINRNIPASGFLVTEIDNGNTGLRQIMRDLHDLYEVEELNLRSAYEIRKQNSLAAKLPKPDKPITIRFWKRDMEKEKAERGVK